MYVISLNTIVYVLNFSMLNILRFSVLNLIFKFDQQFRLHFNLSSSPVSHFYRCSLFL